jgi:xylose isomerase
MPSKNDNYRFSFGPWNIHEGADPFGPPVRPTIEFGRKLKLYRELGFDAVQLHDDDAVPNVDDKSLQELRSQAGSLKKVLADEGLAPEFIAPRLWEDPRGIDGGYTSNSATDRQWAIDRSKRALDIADALGTKLIVLWLAREGTYIRESKNPFRAQEQLVSAINQMLAHNPQVEIVIEPKPNEPVDLSFVPTIGHGIALASLTDSPERVGVLVESAHAKLVGLEPAEEMAFALAMGKLWSVHLNDQNGLKFDQDKSFGSVDLRSAFNQVRVLELAQYAKSGRYVGLDVKAMRTQSGELATRHLSNSREIFLALVDKYRSFPSQYFEDAEQTRDYELLELRVLNHLMGLPTA